VSDVFTIDTAICDVSLDASEETKWSRIKVAACHGTSRVVSCRSVQPLKILNPRNLSDCSQVYLSSYGGGLVAGDDIRLDIECEANSKLFLGTQADTKIYKSVDGKTARQHIRGHIGKDATAVILPDALIPFADSRFEQIQEWHLNSSSNLMLVDWIHSGRTGHGECFDFDSLRSEICIRIDGKKRVIDRLQIEPSMGDPRAAGAFGTYRSYLSMYIVGKSLRNMLQDLDLFQTRMLQNPDFWVVANPAGDDALIIRVMSTKKEAVSYFVKDISRALASNDILGFDPYKRKY